MYTIMHEPGEDVAICFKHDSCTDVIMLDQAMGMAFRLGLTFHDLESMLDALDKALPELDARAKDDPKKGKCLGDVLGNSQKVLELIEKFEAEWDGDE